MNKHIKKIRERAGIHKTIIQNFSYLSVLQIFNLILPLATYPYLIKVLGKETFGLVVFAQAIVGYLVILVEFGFNLSATKEVSIHRNDKEKLSEIVSSILQIKGGLFLFSASIMTFFVFLIPHVNEYKTLFFLTLWMCFYDFIFPIWYFQGIEKMKYITLMNLLSRTIFVVLIFILVKERKDYLFVPLIYGIGSVVAGVVSITIVFTHNIKFIWQPYNILKYYFKNSIPIFISNLSTSLSLSTNKVILGLSLGMQEVAYYELAEKLSLISKTPIQLIGQAIYPQVAQNKNRKFLKGAFLITLIVTSIILLGGILFANTIIKLAGGLEMVKSVMVFQILIISIIPVTISLFYANIVLISWNLNKDYLRIRIYTSIFYFIVVFFLILSHFTNLISLALTTLLVESFAALLSVYISKRRNVNFLRF